MNFYPRNQTMALMENYTECTHTNRRRLKHNTIKTYRRCALVYTIINTFIILSCLLDDKVAECFNLDSKFPIIISHPGKQYFGYSVDMYTDNEDTWLLVGSPNARSGRGDVFMYRYRNGMDDPEKVVLDLDKEVSATTAVPEMLGWTVKAAPNKQCLACAPLFTQEYTSELGQLFYDSIGICYLITNFMQPKPLVYKLLPCESRKGAYHDGDEHGQCLAGFSATFTKNGDGVLIGAPGSYYKQGTILFDDLPITTDLTTLPTYIGEVIPTNIWPGWKKDDYLRATYDDNYLGYDVATGKSAGNSPILVASAPRRFGYDLLGMVLVYDEEMKALYNFTGRQTGEYFGHSVAVVDVNNDNLDDVVVGAPFYSNLDKKFYENGRVFVFQQIPQDSISDKEQQTVLFSQPLIIEGKKNAARFGNTVKNLGDINLDGYNDIGVSAPYSEDNSGGSLFVYNGEREGLRDESSQEISGINIQPDMETFAFSVAGEKDADHNGYPDVITGAYLADKVVLLRSRPVVNILSTVTVMPSEIDLEQRECPKSDGPSNVGCIVMKTCFTYKGKALPSSLDIQYVYNIDSTKTGDNKRAFLLDEKPRNLTLNKQPEIDNGLSEKSCIEETAYLQVDIKDKLNTMKIELTYCLIEKNIPVEPVLNMLSEPTALAYVEIAKDCGTDNICQPDLKLSTVLTPKVAFVGTSTPFTIVADVTNKGEPSYETKLVVEYPDTVYFVGIQADEDGFSSPCVVDENIVICNIGNPLKRNSKVTVTMKFSVYDMVGNVSLLNFNAFVNSTNPVDSESNQVQFDMQMAVSSRVTIYNISDPEIIFLNTDKNSGRPEVNETEVSHTYQIRNHGPSNIQKALITIQWPYQNSEGDFLMEFDEIFSSESVECSEVKEKNKSGRNKREVQSGESSQEIPPYKYYHCDKEAKCFSLECMINNFQSQQEINIEVKSTLLMATIRDESDAEIRSELQFQIEKYPYEINRGPGPRTFAQTKTFTSYSREPISSMPWWIILVAVLGGVLVLIILIVCFWKCGFFKRKRRPMEEQDREQKEPLHTNMNEDEQEMETYLK